MPTEPPIIDDGIPPVRPCRRSSIGRGLAFGLFMVSAVVCGLSFTQLNLADGGVNRFLFIVSGLSAIVFGAEFVAARWA